MAQLPSGLETFDYGTQGWSSIVAANTEKIDENLRGPFLATKNLGDDSQADNAGSQADPAALTSADLTDNSGGTPDQIVAAVESDIPALTAAALTDNSGGTPDQTIEEVESDLAPMTGAALTDSSGGTASQTVGAVSGSGADAAINDNFASLSDEVNKVITDIGTIESVVEAMDDKINNNFADISDEVNKLRADTATIKTTVDAMDDVINGNFADLVDEVNKIRADMTAIRTALIGTIDYADTLKTTLNALLAILRKTGGCGILAD